MNKDFSRIITLLRKEKQLSQKQAAADLEISQALLSHYEKGIRECGLDFVVRTADYYGVSCDYLLGRTPERTGATLSAGDIPQASSETAAMGGTILNTLNKKLIMNSIDIMFGILSVTGNKGLTAAVSNYMMVSVYKMFRVIYSSNKTNPKGMFSVDSTLYMGLASAQQNICEVKANALANGIDIDKFEAVRSENAQALSPEIIMDKFPKYSSSLLNLIQTTEDKIKKIN